MSTVDWNTQELINASAIEKLAEGMCQDQHTLYVGKEVRLELALQALQSGSSLAKIVQQVIEQLEKSIISQILTSTSGNKAEAARRLKIDYKTLYRKLKKYCGALPEPTVERNDADGV